MIKDVPDSGDQDALKREVEQLRHQNAELRSLVDTVRDISSRTQALLLEVAPIAAEGDAPDGAVRMLSGHAPEAAKEIAVRARQWAETAPEDRLSQEFDVVSHDARGHTRLWRVVVAERRSDGRLLVSARDVTGSRARLESLRETESIHHTLLNLLPEPVLFTDFKGTLLYINPSGAALLGANEMEEVLGTSIWSYVHKEDLPRMRRRSRRLLSGEAVDETRVRFIRRDSKEIHVETHSVATRYEGQPAVLSTARDLTEHRLAASAIRESREMLVKVFHASPAAIAVTRPYEDRIIDVNEAWCELTGYALNEALGHTTVELGLWADPQVGRELVRRIAVEKQLGEIEFSLRRKNGTLRTVLASTQQIYVQGEPATLCVLSDITSRKQMELKLVEARDRAQEMAALRSSFLTNMTHEIRTPLTVILGFTTMLKQGVQPAYRRFVSVIERSGKRLLLTLDSIIDLAQLESGSLQVDRIPYRVQDALESVIEDVEPLAKEKGLNIDYQRLEPTIHLSGGHRIFTRIIHHLLDNAVKFTDSGTIEVRVEADENSVYVNVTDTGIGIDAAFLPHVFEEFSQESTGLERTHQGSGLGLTVSQGLARSLGGTIDVESQKGTGSRFKLTLPRDLAA